jgi:ribose transport system ATP-binding protein
MTVGAGCPALTVQSVSKAFGRSTALAELDLTIAPGQIHALLGQNGSGKSTLIKILSGYHAPDTGHAWVAGKPLTFQDPERSAALGMRFVHQDLALVETLSVADNMYLGGRFPTRLGSVRERALRSETSRALAEVGLDVDPAEEVGTLAPAVRAGIAIARALQGIASSGVKVLVLDEPTASLSFHEVGQLLNTVRAVADHGVAVLYVSHHLTETFAVADMVTVLRDGHKTGTWNVAELSHDVLVRAIVGQSEGASVNDERASVRITRSHTRTVLEVSGLCSGIIADAELAVRAGEIVGIAGLTGSGRELLLPAIFGARGRTAGEVRVDGVAIVPSRPDAAMAAGVAYVPSDRKATGLFAQLSSRENLTISDVMRFWRFPRLAHDAELDEVRSWFQRLGITPADGHSLPVSALSGGNQQKVLLARWLRRDSRVLLLGDPTEGVDVGAQAEIHRQIRASAARGAAVVISSISPEELCGLCDRVVVLRHGRITATLAGEALTAASIVSASSGSAT